jgi:hypothetical protein
MEILVTGGTGKAGTAVVHAASPRCICPYPDSEQGCQAAHRGRGSCQRPAQPRLGSLGSGLCARDRRGLGGQVAAVAAAT